MKMRDYEVKVRVTGTVTVFVSAPDYEEAEEIAIENAQSLDLRDEDLDYEVISSEEDNDE